MNGYDPALVPEPSVEIVGGIVRRSYRIPAGMALLGHIHDYDHLSILYSGDAQLLVGDTLTELKGPQMLVIKAGIAHQLLARTECRWDCLHGFDEAKAAHDAGDAYAFLGLKD